MSEKLPLREGLTYRGLVIVCVIPHEAVEADEIIDDAPRFVVVVTAHRQVVSLYECQSIGEAMSLIDAIWAKAQADSLPAGGAGGARAESRVAGSMQTV